MARIPEHPTSPTNTVLLAHGRKPTLDLWLSMNGVENVFDAELLEVLPVEFRSEYEDLLRLHCHYETKFAESSDESDFVTRASGK